jgi:hypothetical protein
MEKKNTRRCFVLHDALDFGEKALPLLKRACSDLLYLVDRDYNDESAAAFVGNHYQLPARQRTALLRSACTTAAAQIRKSRMKASDRIQGETVFFDTFNIIITLEAALSPETTLLLCMDRTIRDLCGLHGTYRIIPDTGKALRQIFRFLKRKHAASGVFYIDSPVSNSGKLKALILKIKEEENFPAGAMLIQNSDRELFGKENVVSSDSVVLDRCKSWLNGAFEIISYENPERKFICLNEKR